MLLSVWFLLFATGAANALRPAAADLQGVYAITPLENRNGWVNPEDLAPMPQCIAQQDQSAWLDAMTRCVGRQCTRHFGIICTHHQWLIQLTCLSTEFSPELISPYMPYCGRSVLAKAQLLQWIHAITGRTWLVNVGDANGLQSLTPASLPRGYAAVEVIEKSPACLRESHAERSMEPFQHVLASCGFTSHVQHSGNAARPWEYRESLRSMVALDFETAGYDTTHRSIPYNDYFDRDCFCKTFRSDGQTESCQSWGLDSTKERLWLNATCGPKSLPPDWMNGLQTTTFAFIPTKDWRWPDNKAAMPHRIIRLAEHCTADACALDSDGYCSVERAVDRTRFCRGVNYEDCDGPCRVFESRIQYLNWLHDVCGSVKGWHGLPKHWRQLAALTPADMIPWRWNLKPSTSRNHEDSVPCASMEVKLESIIAINLATLLATLFAHAFTSTARTPAKPDSTTLPSWLLSGLAISALHLIGHGMNAAIVQATAGYSEVSILQLVLLWSAMPRLTWLSPLIALLLSSQRTILDTLASCLVAEIILQALSAVPMLQTITYGCAHSFYSWNMARLDGAPAAQYMYAGAALWLIAVILIVVPLLQLARDAIESEEQTRTRLAAPSTSPNQINKIWNYVEDDVAKRFVHSPQSEAEALLHGEVPSYGTLPLSTNEGRARRHMARLAIVVIGGSFLLWLAQGMFWAGYLGLSAGEYCPPQLGLLTAVWSAAPLVGVLVATSAIAREWDAGE